MKKKLKSKSREEADKMLENAMRMDVDKEVERRLERMSRGDTSARRGQSEDEEEDDMFARSVTGSESLKSMLKPAIKNTQPEEKKEKKVNWAESP
jgi:uncharacterized membrane-anchored protein